MRVLFNNPALYVWQKRSKLEGVFADFLDSGHFILGNGVEAFEKAWAEYVGVHFCVSVGNGTDALQLAIQSLELPESSKIATVANAGMYATSAILASKNSPYFIDIGPNTLGTSLEEVKKATQKGAVAVVVTHLFGQIVREIEEIAEYCRRQGVWLIEDCAQAHGAEINGKKAGSFGDLAAFSFYPTKNLGALGDGGAIVSSNQAIAHRVRDLRQYGWGDKYKVEKRGGRNSRLDELQAQLLLVFLEDLDSRNYKRKKIAQRYALEIKNPKVQLLEFSDKKDYVAHLFCLKVEDRRSLRDFLTKNQIGSDIHYPTPDHRQSAFSKEFESVTLPVTEKIATQILSIPCFPEMQDHEVDYVIETINSW